MVPDWLHRGLRDWSRGVFLLAGCRLYHFRRHAESGTDYLRLMWRLICRQCPSAQGRMSGLGGYGRLLAGIVVTTPELTSLRWLKPHILRTLCHCKTPCIQSTTSAQEAVSKPHLNSMDSFAGLC